MPRCTFLSPCMHHLCSFRRRGWRRARRRAVLTAADTTNTAHKKDPPPYFVAPPWSLQLLIAPPHRATAVDRHSVRDPFFLPVRERVTSLPLPCAPHVGAGLPADRRFAGPFHLGTPPCPLGVSCPGGPKSVPPVSTIIPRTCTASL